MNNTNKNNKNKNNMNKDSTNKNSTNNYMNKVLLVSNWTLMVDN